MGRSGQAVALTPCCSGESGVGAAVAAPPRGSPRPVSQPVGVLSPCVRGCSGCPAVCTAPLAPRAA
eukprot:scaffold13454_cov114-Isochrysis_galbana.AAC.9